MSLMKGATKSQCSCFTLTLFPLFNQFGREVLDIAGAHIKPGVTTDEIDRIVHEVCMYMTLCNIVCQLVVAT